MKTPWKLFGCSLLPAVLACGCSCMNHTEEGAATGGVLGGVAGAIVGSAARAPGVGAVIGAGTGALIGAAAGHAKDKAEQRAAAEDLRARQNALPMEQVVSMVQNHVSDAIIINQIRATGALYYLRAEDITWLKQQGVSDVVIGEMQATASPRYPQRVVVVEPAPPPPPVGVGVGVGFSRRF
jgi:hypothetical protein